jgi:hypothetical protein
MSPICDKSEDKLIESEFKRASPNRKLDGTPIKTLIAQEMLKEVASNQNSPSIVAKLMGLDSLPRQQQGSDARRTHSRGYSLNHLDLPSADWQQEHRFHDQDEYKDVYEIWHQSPKANKVREKSPQKGRINDSCNEKKLELVRQKFVEAKRLATDENLRQTKQFQDVLEELSSNKDLFLKILQEPNSLFSQHQYNLHSTNSIPQPPETKRITVLKPAKTINRDNFTDIKKTSNNFSCDLDEHHARPTRIVVLKPSCVKNHDAKTVDSSSSLSLRESNEIETPSRHRRDETLLSSVFSNGYIGDESSFSKSEIEYEDGNLSESEVISPVSRHSWDYINKFGSPYSSSFSRASFSPESSVCREAKKRLSERWALVASNDRHMRKNSSTLGEMLALSNTKKSEEPLNKKDEIVSSNLNKDEKPEDSPKNLLRSKSVPVSSTAYGARLNVEVSDTEVAKTTKSVPKELTKSTSAKSSLKGRVSSLFFSRNKKSTKDKSSQPSDEPQSAETSAHPSGKSSTNNASQCVDILGTDEVSPNSISGRANQGITSFKAGNLGENLDQPSPISVLEPLFEEDDRITPDQQGLVEFAVSPIQSNLIGKSPLIGSIARTLSWDDTCAPGPTTPDHSPSISSKTEEQEWHSFLQTLLPIAESSLATWHSPESPLDPSIRETYADSENAKDTTIIPYESKRRQRRSTQKLVFDCVNTLLASEELRGAQSVDSVYERMKEWFDGGEIDSLAVDEVRKEVVGPAWLWREDINDIGSEIQGKLLEDLLDESVLELAK